MATSYWALTDNPATADVDEAHMFEPHYELHLWVHDTCSAANWRPFGATGSAREDLGMEDDARGLQAAWPEGATLTYCSRQLPGPVSTPG